MRVLVAQLTQHFEVGGTRQFELDLRRRAGAGSEELAALSATSALGECGIAGRGVGHLQAVTLLVGSPKECRLRVGNFTAYVREREVFRTLVRVRIAARDENDVAGVAGGSESPVPIPREKRLR